MQVRSAVDERNDSVLPDVGGLERVGSLIAGTALAVMGLRGRSFTGAGLALLGGALIHRGATGRCRVYRSLGIDTSRRRHAEARHERGIEVRRTITIDRPAAELYRAWSEPSNLPSILSHVESVERLNRRRSHWVARGPAGVRVEWDAEIFDEVENEWIAWRSLPESGVHNLGSVRFLPLPGGRGTQVDVALDYIPPAGRLGAAVARLLGEDPGQQIAEDLRRFKAVMEAGEVRASRPEVLVAETASLLTRDA